VITFCRTCTEHSEVSYTHTYIHGCEGRNLVGSEVIAAVRMKITVSCDVTPCNPVLEETAASIFMIEVKLLLAGCLLGLLFDREDGGSMFLRNYDELTPYFMLWSSHTSGPGQITFPIRIYIYIYVCVCVHKSVRPSVCCAQFLSNGTS
jgi:hypothetical protein